MGEYVVPLLFLVTVFVAFGLAHRNHYRGCSDCKDDCDGSGCEVSRKPR
jgi:hypothetical protein